MLVCGICKGVIVLSNMVLVADGRMTCKCNKTYICGHPHTPDANYCNKCGAKAELLVVFCNAK